MELVTVADLEVGDEIIISSQSTFRYFKVLRKPAFGKKVHWRTKDPLYKSVLCSARRIETTDTSRGYTCTSRDYIPTFEDHNIRMSVDLSFRSILLINKSKI